MGVQLANLVVTAHGIPLVALEADHHPRRNPLAAEHERQGRGEILAMPRGCLVTKSSIGSSLGIAGLADQAVLELPRHGKLPLQVARPADAIFLGQAGLVDPTLGQLDEVRQCRGAIGLGKLQRPLRVASNRSAASAVFARRARWPSSPACIETAERESSSLRSSRAGRG